MSYSLSVGQVTSGFDSIGSGGECGDEIEAVLETDADSQADSSSVVHGDGVDVWTPAGNRGTVQMGVGERECEISEARAWWEEVGTAGDRKSGEGWKCDAGREIQLLGGQGEGDRGYERGGDVTMGVRS